MRLRVLCSSRRCWNQLEHHWSASWGWTRLASLVRSATRVSNVDDIRSGCGGRWRSEGKGGGRFLSFVWWTRARDRGCTVANRLSPHFPFLQQRLRGSNPTETTATTKGSEKPIRCLPTSLKSLAGLFRPNLRRCLQKSLKSGRDLTITMGRRRSSNLFRSTSKNSWILSNGAIQ